MVDTLVLTYCRNQMLPIWERWTDRNSAMRQCIEVWENPVFPEAMPATALVNAMCRLFRCTKDSSNSAALSAAITVIYAIQGHPLDLIVEAGLQAITANAEAEENLHWIAARA
jgi:hypothetical protein